MAGTVNKVILIGRLGADPDVRYTTEGGAVCNLNLATDEPEKQSDGSWGSRPEWHRVVVYGKLAELAAQYLTKGKQCYLEGKLRTRQWEDKDGVKRYTTEIVAKELVFLGGSQNNSNQTQTGSSSGSNPATRGGQQATPPVPSDPDSDIPF